MAYRFDNYDNSIVIDGWERGIADSPYAGISDMRNMNIVSVPGEASVNFKTTSVTPGNYTGSMTGSTASDETITLNNTSIPNGTVLIFAGGSLPTGITAGTAYMVKQKDSNGHYFAYTTWANYLTTSNVNTITDGGTGTFTTVTMGKPTYFTTDYTNGGTLSQYYLIDLNGRVWNYDGTSYWIYLLGNDTTTTTNAHGNGIIAYRGYIMSFRDGLIDDMKISNGVWDYGRFALNTAGGTANSHEAFISTDDHIYYCDSNFLGSLVQAPGATFDPTSSSTYTWSSQALILPSTDIANCLTQLGLNLLVGGQHRIIYSWDRSAQALSGFIPIFIAEDYISKITTINTNAYVLAGNRGRIYITNGSQAQLWKKIPDHISGTIEPYYKWGGLASTKNQIYFGVQAFDNPTFTEITEYGGVWAIDIDTGALRLSNKLSYNTYAGLATAILPQILVPTSSAPGAAIFIGWDSGASTYGVDKSSSSPYTSSEATVDSDLIPIGTFDKTRNFNRVEFKLNQALVSGESITVQYRLLFGKTDANSGTAQYVTMLTDSTTGDYSSSGSVNFKNAQWIQFRVISSSTASSPSYVRLKEIRINGLTGPTLGTAPQLSL